MKRGLVHNILNKRFSHLSDHLMNFLEKEEVKIYKKIIKHSNGKLNPIKKKKLNYPHALYPLKGAPLEWWYFTGHLQHKNKKYGFEYCLFKFHPLALRMGFIPLSFLRKKPFLAFHFALTDKNNKTFQVYQDTGIIHQQEFNYNNLNISLNNTSLKLDKTFKLKTKNKVADLELTLTPLKKIVPHFDHGYTVMYAPPESRTYYLTFSRLKTKGTLKVKNRKYDVTGLSWFDHQKLNLPKNSSLRGWDWFSIILNDNTELMFFMLRNKKGLTKKFMGGTYINKNSKIINLSPEDVIMENVSTWKSPYTKVEYPSGWKLKVPKLKLTLKINPCIKNQEITRMLSTPMNYWEGACDVIGVKQGKKVKGQSYVELVGYDKRFLTKLMQSMYR